MGRICVFLLVILLVFAAPESPVHAQDPQPTTPSEISGTTPSTKGDLPEVLIGVAGIISGLAGLVTAFAAWRKSGKADQQIQETAAGTKQVKEDLNEFRDKLFKELWRQDGSLLSESLRNLITYPGPSSQGVLEAIQLYGKFVKVEEFKELDASLKQYQKEMTDLVEQYRNELILLAAQPDKFKEFMQGITTVGRRLNRRNP